MSFDAGHQAKQVLPGEFHQAFWRTDMYVVRDLPDELFFDHISTEHLIQGEWEIMCEFQNVEKIEDHIIDWFRYANWYEKETRLKSEMYPPYRSTGKEGFSYFDAWIEQLGMQ